jgi:hypothetical protein
LTSNFIEIYPDALSPELCVEACNRMDDIISRPDPGNSCILSDNDSRTDWNIFTGRYASLKKSEDKIIQAVSVSWRKYKNSYNTTSKSFFEVFNSGWKFQKSETSGGYHEWHYEQGSGEHNSTRFAVWMLYLNDVEIGGKTEFKYQEVAIKPTAGTIVIWPAAYTHVHRANPDLIGEKYIATGWFNYPNRERFR